MLSIIIPAHNEEPYLNRTIENICQTAYGPVEVLVIDQGGNGEIDLRAVVITPGENVGERAAMNLAAERATGEFLLRIDAHCDFSPAGWDRLMCEATGERDLTMAVLTALRKPWDLCSQAERQKWLDGGARTRDEWQDWGRLPGHWYGLTRLIISEDEAGRKGLEAKWQKPNRDHDHYQGVHPTMAATGCGMMIRKAFYLEIGGADESLPAMGAIGEEFAVKAWAHGGKCQVQSDVMLGHIFGTGGYDTSGVKVAQQALYERYGHLYDEIAGRFPTFEGLRLIKTDQPAEVIVTRTDVTETRRPDSNVLLRRRTVTACYVWRLDEHPDERGLSEAEIRLKYGPQAVPIEEKVEWFDEQGRPVDQA